MLLISSSVFLLINVLQFLLELLYKYDPEKAICVSPCPGLPQAQICHFLILFMLSNAMCSFESVSLKGAAILLLFGVKCPIGESMKISILALLADLGKWHRFTSKRMPEHCCSGHASERGTERQPKRFWNIASKTTVCVVSSCRLSSVPVAAACAVKCWSPDDAISGQFCFPLVSKWLVHY